MRNFFIKAFLIFVISFLFASYAQAQGNLETPEPNSYQSGLSIISGWYCNASSIHVQIDGGDWIEAAYGGERRDTESICGDWDNGFVFAGNYNVLGDGLHEANVYADGVLFGSVQFEVVTFGSAFLTGVQKSVLVSDFPNDGDTATLIWDEAKQAFVLTEATSSVDPNPQLPPNSISTTENGVEIFVELAGSFFLGKDRCIFNSVVTNKTGIIKNAAVFLYAFDQNGEPLSGGIVTAYLRPGVSEKTTNPLGFSYRDDKNLDCDDIGSWGFSSITVNDVLF
ncbi:MAG: hypothetical protein K9L82_13645 [Chromatiaceae bacterium]|nr:hypothetical protein [Chromatiaceae bacterium]MCF7993224.1 hypothetical protein [Chromatiaceae bacterium]MCF8004504.1 hypothetical protein [Chromatiaceae bacterium]